MRVFKFGGASVKDAEAIVNLAEVIQQFQNEPLLIVISAMGKTTNALEEILDKAYQKGDFQERLKLLKDYHLTIINNLFGDEETSSKAFVEELFDALLRRLEAGVSTEKYNKLYDEVISQGEIISTKIVNAYLQLVNINSEWVDARLFIKTDSTFREAHVDWEVSCRKITQELHPQLKNKLLITQGFIGSDAQENTTTLGREGSDFTAAIFSSCLDAKEVVIWKDVDGILNADPKRIKEAVKYEELPYQEAAEMTFYGASVIHPKTIKPLANKKIPLWVRPFNNIMATGTCIHECEVKNLIPAIIFKPNQCLISFKVKDFTFISEKNLSVIFHELDALNIKINVMQNSAISLSICVDNQDYKITALLDRLRKDFDIYYNEQLLLITVKNYNLKVIDALNENKAILLEQRTRNNYQIVIKE